MDIEYRKMSFNTLDELRMLVDLQNEVYKERGLNFNIKSFKRWYVDNPAGGVISYNAFDGDRMVAHYACIPTAMKINGTIVKGVLSMAVVTHPSYRGKGLFKTLATKTYALAKELGFEFVVGVANANSFPGFMKYFPFVFIGRLDVKWGWGKITLPEKMFSRYWNPQSIMWRCSKRDYRIGGRCVYGRYGKYPFIKTFMGVIPNDLVNRLTYLKKTHLFRPFNLYVGIGADLSKGHYFNVPKFIKHSPFNLRFMDLTDDKHLPIPNKDNIVFQLIDFDVA